MPLINYRLLPIYSMSVFRFLTPAVILFFLSNAVSAKSYSIKGQFWASGKLIENQSNFMMEIGYIPTFSAYYELQKSRMVDLEWAYRLDRSYSGNTLDIKNEKYHRYWVRYSSDKLEARLGLQKIVFGPSQVLRTLSWFDTIDPEDPTDQTEGVEASRLRYFPSNSVSLWAWAINNDKDTLSIGGRGELSTSLGEWGLTYHQDPSKSFRIIGQGGIPVMGPHNRLALDYRYDGFIGFWNESAIIQSDNMEINMIMLGADYTLPIGNGILVMTESMYISSKDNILTSSQTFTSFMASMPMGMFYNLMLISTLHWNENNSYNYLRFSSAFDSFSINCMASINPREVGNSIQLMFIYNH